MTLALEVRRNRWINSAETDERTETHGGQFAQRMRWKTKGRNEPIGMPTIVCWIFLPSSELFPSKASSYCGPPPLHSYVFLSLLRFGPETLLKCPPSSLSLFLIRLTRVYVPLFVSPSLHSLNSLSLPLPISLPLSPPPLIRYTDSSFQWTSFKRRLLP